MSSTNVPVSAHEPGLGYGIGIAVGILVLVSTIMLTSYICVRVKAGSAASRSGGGSTTTVGPTPESTVVMGLDNPTIASYPKLILNESRRLPRPNNGPCSICLMEYRPKDTVRCMPDCNHCFHVDCIDEWLRMSATCPICRNSPVPSVGPTPLTTPLSELVPLAFSAR